MNVLDEACGCVCDGCLENCGGFTEAQPVPLTPRQQVLRTAKFLGYLAMGTLLGVLLVVGTVVTGMWLSLNA